MLSPSAFHHSLSLFLFLFSRFVFQSLSVSFFIPFDATFALAHLQVTSPFSPLLSLSILVSLPVHKTESSFSFIPTVPSFFLLVRRLRPLFVHSTSFTPSLPLLYLFPDVLSLLLLRSGYAATPSSPRYLSRFSTHVNACSLIFLGSLFLAFVPPLPMPPLPPPALRDIFRFPFRYVRSVSDT